MTMTTLRQSASLVGSGLARRFFARLLAMREVARQRRQLAELSEAALKDIGISRADAERESALPFWRI